MPSIYCDGGTRDGGSSGGITQFSSSGVTFPGPGSGEINPFLIIINGILGLGTLYLVNLLPFVHIPINMLTVLFTSIIGILGVIILIIASIIGFI